MSNFSHSHARLQAVQSKMPAIARSYTVKPWFWDYQGKQRMHQESKSGGPQPPLDELTGFIQHQYRPNRYVNRAVGRHFLLFPEPGCETRCRLEPKVRL